MDRINKEKRSYNMSQIKSGNTKPELIMMGKLKETGLRYTRSNSNLPGKPDFVIKKCRVSIFVDGEFWHGKKFDDWKDKLSPFWLKKIGENIRRDRRNNRLLRSDGWIVLHFWGKDVVKNPDRCAKRIRRYLNKSRTG